MSGMAAYMLSRAAFISGIDMWSICGGAHVRGTNLFDAQNKGMHA
jgi:hypothetical protein